MSVVKEDPRVRGLLDRVAEFDKKICELKGELTSTQEELEAYQMAIADDEWHRREIATLHEFVADVRLGIRDLDEYEEVCRRAGLVA